jgi:CubicO group peptidase (beta-lactamase class C family)
MSKPLVTTAAMLLSDPEFKLVLAKREITIRDLMSYKAGITYIFAIDWFKDRKHQLLIDLYRNAGVTDGLCQQDGRVGRMVRSLARLPLIGQPGEVWEYGLATDVLGHLVEKVSGMKLNDFIQARVLTPLKMNDTYFVVPQSKTARLSAVWESDWKGNLKKRAPDH